MNSTHRVKPIVGSVAAAIAIAFIGSMAMEVPLVHAAMALEQQPHLNPGPPPFASRNGGGATR